MTKIHRHGPIESLAENLWIVTGSSQFPLPRNMVIHRLPTGSLFLHSVVAMHEEGMRALEAIGPPGVIVVPSASHRLDAPFYKERYPNAVLLCPEASRARVAEKVPVDGTCEERLEDLGVRVYRARGLKPVELVYGLDIGKTPQTALVFNDALFHLEHQPGLAGMVLRGIGSTGFFGMSRLARFSLLESASELADWLREMSHDDGLRCVTVSHGAPLVEDVGARLRDAAERIDGRREGA
ncbi:MAG: hypothetical protein HYV07_10375 [Deltaproteobacteria bacterium]|nr:hypothetical protein [Deltaproteobacteria bacterium]